MLKKFVFPPIVQMLDDRKKRIAEGLAAADVARREAEEERKELMAQLEAERAEAQKRVAAASAQAEKVREEILAQARREAEEIKTRAIEEAETEKQRILAEAHKQIAELALLAAERVVREGLDESVQHKIIDDFLSQVSLN
ncbi:MAG TPA: F0F1 ATP synthase subunit B [Caldilineae bacterium]|nr:F0F1 ATP synthase subunit B [Caldilineae bacterium]